MVVWRRVPWGNRHQGFARSWRHKTWPTNWIIFSSTRRASSHTDGDERGACAAIQISIIATSPPSPPSPPPHAVPGRLLCITTIYLDDASGGAWCIDSRPKSGRVWRVVMVCCAACAAAAHCTTLHTTPSCMCHCTGLRSNLTERSRYQLPRGWELCVVYEFYVTQVSPRIPPPLPKTELARPLPTLAGRCATPHPSWLSITCSCDLLHRHPSL